MKLQSKFLDSYFILSIFFRPEADILNPRGRKFLSGLVEL